MGPPINKPSSLRSRYLIAIKPSAYFVAMPQKAVIHIQKIAPGPPIKIADATPIMLPAPMVPESAVIRDCIGVIPSLASVCV